MNTPTQTIFNTWTAEQAEQFARECRKSRWVIYSADDYSFYLIDHNGVHGVESPRDALISLVNNTESHDINSDASRDTDDADAVRETIIDLLQDFYYGWGDVMGTAGGENYLAYCNIITSAIAKGERPDEDELNAAALRGLTAYDSYTDYENEAIVKFIQERNNIEEPRDAYDIDAIVDETIGRVGNKFFTRDPKNFSNIIERHSYCY